jgi:disulfide bond formation protein DsbB
MTANAHPATVADARRTEPGWGPVFLCWVVAATATQGALFFSEVMALPPCVLCWYQRIFMFPLALLLPLGLFPFDRRIVRYALPLAGVGWVLALFHVLLTYGLIPESIKPCTQGVPCDQNPIVWFGFVSIPVLSLAAFSAIIALLVTAHYRTSQ